MAVSLKILLTRLDNMLKFNLVENTTVNKSIGGLLG